MHVVFYLLLLFLMSCSPSSLEDFQIEGEAIAKALVQELKSIETREDLPKAQPKLKKKFTELGELMIAARQFQEAHRDEEDSFAVHSHSEELREELQRIYALEGGREAIEKAQREALFRLDAFEQGIK